MSGAQGAQTKESYTATTYESLTVGSGEGKNRTKMDLKRREDEEGGIEIDKLQDKVEDAAGEGGPVFGASAQQQRGDDKPDLGVTAQQLHSTPLHSSLSLFFSLRSFFPFRIGYCGQG